ncbi:MAG: LysR family transcriptional regulator [Alphaproteobacteria bacterium]|nr:LysR family transcriptional regulator [Alphaproteobacteria bacterium]
MARNLDMTALRSFVAVAESGGVTRAAGFLNLTQSAVSMQLKRLEESLGQSLLDRSARRIGLTAQGEQLLGYGRRMLALNDEVYGRLTGQSFEGEIALGVPSDIVYPYIPGVLKHFAEMYPRVRVHLISSYTKGLKRKFERGECDLILTTEAGIDDGGETLVTLPLVWIGAPGGSVWKIRPLRLAFEHNCLFRGGVQEALDRAGIDWEMAVESDSTRTIEASVAADLAVHACIEGSRPEYLEDIDHGGHLPELSKIRINMYMAERTQSPLAAELAALVRQAYRSK